MHRSLFIITLTLITALLCAQTTTTAPPLTAPQPAPATQPAPVTPGSAGIVPRLAQPNDTLYCWSDFADNSAHPADIKLLDSNNNIVSHAQPWGEAMAVGTLTAPASPGTYTAFANNHPLGTITVTAPLSSPNPNPNPNLPPSPTIIEVTDPNTIDWPKIPDNAILHLPRGTFNLTRSFQSLSVRVTLESQNDTTLNLACPKYNSCFQASAPVTFRGVKLASAIPGARFVLVQPTGALRLENCTIDAAALNSNGGPIERCSLIHCNFTRGAGVRIASNSAVIDCAFSGRPRVEHPIFVTGSNTLIANCNWQDTERAIVASDNVSDLAICYCRFQTSGQTNQKESPLLAEDVRTFRNVLLAGNRCDVDGGISLWAKNTVGKFQAIYLHGNRFTNANDVLAIQNFQPGGTIADITIRELHASRCSHIARIFAPDLPTTAARLAIDASTIVDSTPTPNTNGDVGQTTPEDFNPRPARFAALNWDPTNNSLTDPAGNFDPAMVGCTVQTTKGPDEIVAVLSPNKVLVRNFISSAHLDVGPATIKGLVLIQGTWRVTNTRIIRPFGNPFSEDVITDRSVIVR